MKNLLALTPFIPGTFVFFGLYQHAEPWAYYYLGACVMVVCGVVSFGIWKNN